MATTSQTSLRSAQVRYVTGWASSMQANYCPRHTHPTLEIVYHVRGHGTSNVADVGPVAFQAGSVTLYPPHVAHDQATQADGEDCCVHLEAAPPVTAHVKNTIHIPRLTDTYVHRELHDLAAASSPRSDLDRICLNHRAHAVFVRLLMICRGEAEPPTAAAAHRYAERAFEHIASDFQRIAGLDAVAAHVGVSQDYLRHVFRQRYGISLKAHLTQCRIEHAKSLLTYSTLPAKTIAQQCGFASDRHFSTTFQTHVGKPPIAYRRSQAQP